MSHLVAFLMGVVVGVLALLTATLALALISGGTVPALTPEHRRALDGWSDA